MIILIIVLLLSPLIFFAAGVLHRILQIAFVVGAFWYLTGIDPVTPTLNFLCAVTKRRLPEVTPYA